MFPHSLPSTQDMDRVHALEKRASLAYHAAETARKKLLRSDGSMVVVGAEAEEAARLAEEHMVIAAEVADLKRSLGLAAPPLDANGRSPLPVPGGSGRSGTRIAEIFRDNPQLPQQPTGAVRLGQNLVDVALGRPAGGGYQAAVAGSGMGTRVFPPEVAVGLPRRRLSVIDRIPLAGEIDALGSVTIEFFRVTARTNLAAVVDPLGEKPASVFTLERANTTLRKYATLSEQVATEYLVGNAVTWGSTGLQDLLENDLAQDVLEAFEADCLSGDGSGKPDGLTHISGTSSTASTGDPIADLRTGIATLQAASVEPDAIVVNTADLRKLDLEQTGDGSYLLGGPTSDGPSRVWRTPIIASNGLTAGTAIVGSFATGMLRWSGISMLSWGPVGDDFKYNALRLVAEAGLAAAVVRPSAFNLVTIN